MSDDSSIAVKVLSVKSWTPTLFSFRVTRPEGFKFTAGQFVRLGVNPSLLAYFKDGKEQNVEDSIIFRAYSVVSSPYDEFIEFFSIVIPDGAFTSQLQFLAQADTLYLNPTPFGFLTLTRYQLPLPNDLWLLATGTGLAPFLSILKTLEVWEQYEHIILVYSARTTDELAYVDEIKTLKSTYGEAGASFTFMPIVTRDDNYQGLKQRLPGLIASGALEEQTGYQLSADTSHVMLCGNPQMIEDTKEALKNKGLTMNRRGEGNIAVENYW